MGQFSSILVFLHKTDRRSESHNISFYSQNLRNANTRLYTSCLVLNIQVIYEVFEWHRQEHSIQKKNLFIPSSVLRCILFK